MIWICYGEYCMWLIFYQLLGRKSIQLKIFSYPNTRQSSFCIQSIHLKGTSDKFFFRFLSNSDCLLQASQALSLIVWFLRKPSTYLNHPVHSNRSSMGLARTGFAKCCLTWSSFWKYGFRKIVGTGKLGWQKPFVDCLCFNSYKSSGLLA